MCEGGLPQPQKVASTPRTSPETARRSERVCIGVEPVEGRERRTREKYEREKESACESTASFIVDSETWMGSARR